MESLFRIVVYLLVGIALLTVNYWFIRSLHHVLTGSDVVIVPFQVAGQSDEGGKLGSTLAHMLQARLTQIQRDLQSAQKSLLEAPTAEAPQSVKPPASTILGLWTTGPVNVPVALLEPTSVSVTVGGVEVGGLFSSVQRFIARPNTLQLSVFYTADKALVTGSLDAFPGSKGNAIWIETDKAPEKIVDAVAYTLIQEQLRNESGSQVGSLDLREFQVLLSTLLRTAELNRRVSLGRGASAEFLEMLPGMKGLVSKSPRWLGLAYLTATIAENAGNEQEAFNYWKEVDKLANSATTPGLALDAKAKETIQAKIKSLAAHAEPGPDALEKIREDAAYATSVLNDFFGIKLGDTPVALGDENLHTAYWDGHAVYAPVEVQYLPDITYHEVVHRFTTTVGKLPYEGQSGSVLQSYADIFASLVKQRKLGQTAQQADWVIGVGGVAWVLGQDIQTSGNKSPLFSLKAPGTAYNDPVLGKDPQPDHMDNFVRTSQDNGGIHINSSIINKAFYETAIQIGSEDAAKIWVKALPVFSAAKTMDFRNFARITVEIAGEIFPDDAKATAALRRSWEKVGVVRSPALGRAARGLGGP
jgi:hypothetical protein